MDKYKIISAACIHVLYAVTVTAFVVALKCNEYLIAGGCAAAYSVLRALYWADVEKGAWDQ